MSTAVGRIEDGLAHQAVTRGVHVLRDGNQLPPARQALDGKQARTAAAADPPLLWYARNNLHPVNSASRP